MCPEWKELQKEGQEKVNLFRTQRRQLLCSFKAVNFVICVGQTDNNISRAWGLNDRLKEESSKNPVRLFEVNDA